MPYDIRLYNTSTYLFIYFAPQLHVLSFLLLNSPIISVISFSVRIYQNLYRHSTHIYTYFLKDQTSSYSLLLLHLPVAFFFIKCARSFHNKSDFKKLSTEFIIQLLISTVSAISSLFFFLPSFLLCCSF